MKHVAYVIPALTDLRYIVPLIVTAHELDFITQYVYIERWSSKYNGLSHQVNYDKCVEILKTYAPQLSLANNDFEYDFVVQVETGSSLNCRKRISIQHGFDCAFLTDRLKNIDSYICGSEMMLDFARLHNVNCGILAPYPIQYFSNEMLHLAKIDKSLFVFYPDSGDRNVVDDLVKHYTVKGFDVCVKQRKKHQEMTCVGNHVYDDLWYPAESVVLPSMSQLVVGFGSSAYTDLVPAGVKYVNVELHSDSYPWNVFTHPQCDNYIRVFNQTEINESIDMLLEKDTASVKFDHDLAKQFMIQLFI